MISGVVIFSILVILVIVLVTLTVIYNYKYQHKAFEHELLFVDNGDQFQFQEMVISDYSVNKLATQDTYLVAGAPYSGTTGCSGSVKIYDCSSDKCRAINSFIYDSTDKVGTYVAIDIDIFVLGMKQLLIYDIQGDLKKSIGLDFNGEDYRMYMAVARGNCYIASENGYIYKYTLGQKMKKQKLKYLANSIDCHEDTVVVGGKVIYVLSSNLNIIQKFMLPENSICKSLSISNTSLIIGCPEDNDMRGLVYCYKRWKNVFRRDSTIKFQNLNSGDTFGYVTLSHNELTLVIGAPGQMNVGLDGKTHHGTIFVFNRTTIDKVWQVAQKLIYPESLDSIWNNFGKSIVFSKDDTTLFSTASGSILNTGALYHYSLFKP